MPKAVDRLVPRGCGAANGSAALAGSRASRARAPDGPSSEAAFCLAWAAVPFLACAFSAGRPARAAPAGSPTTWYQGCLGATAGGWAAPSCPRVAVSTGAAPNCGASLIRARPTPPPAAAPPAAGE